MYDYLVIGAGLYGCTIARLLTDAGKKVLIIDKRSEIGGNCASKDIQGIDVHLYGSHVFHTSNKNVWQFVNKYAEFYHFTHKVMSCYNGHVYNFPVNKKTRQDFSIFENSPDYFKCFKDDIYNAFFKEYSEKQWGCDFKDVPQNALKRIPFRDNYNDAYFSDYYCGVPVDGWHAFFDRLTKDINIELNTTYKKGYTDNTKVIYTGPIDQYFNNRYGSLEWRSLQFNFEDMPLQDGQGCSVIHYPEKKYPWTRVTEFKHFLPFADSFKNKFTVTCAEIPCVDNNNPLYPVETEKNLTLLKKYEQLAIKEKNVFFAGRLGTYKYNNMDTTVLNAMQDMEKYI